MVRRPTEAEGWKIAKDRTRCERPGCPLPTDDSWMAVLELPECLRRDVCDACFAERTRGGDRGDVFWRVKRRPSAPRSGPVLDLPALRGLFERLGEVEVADDEGYGDTAEGESGPGEDGVTRERAEQLAGLRYFVALLLIRKRMLKIVDPRDEAEEMADLVVVDPKDDALGRVALHAPPLEEDRLAGLKDELIAALDDTDAGADE